MNAYRSMLAALALAVAALSWRCRSRRAGARAAASGRPHLRIYELEDSLQRYETMLDSTRRENNSLKREMGVSGGSPGGSRDQRDDVDEQDAFEPPQIELGEPMDPGAATRPEILPEETLRAPQPLDPEASHLAGTVRRIELNKLLSGGLDADGKPGDEGVLVVVEPRDSEGRLVHATGQLSVMVRDALKTGRDAQLARWDFEAGELSHYWRKSMLAEGYVFELPWPSKPPEGARLQLWARLVADDGEKYLTQLDVELDATASAASAVSPFYRPYRWTRRTRVPDAPTSEAVPPTRAGRASPVYRPDERVQGETIGESGAVDEPSLVVVPEEPTAEDEPARSATNNGTVKKRSRRRAPASTARQRPEWKPYR